MTKLLFRQFRPLPLETVAQWSERVLNREFLERMMAPALQGVYAGEASRLSATLALGAVFSRADKGKFRGSLAPSGGMGELILALEHYLRERGVTIAYNQEFKLENHPAQSTVLCTSAWSAADLVRSFNPELARLLARCESLPLVTVTAFFPHHAGELKGFGCLFPEAERFNALGVLFNDCIFAGRSQDRAETWILGGAKNPAAIDAKDEELREQILRDRARLQSDKGQPLSMHITRWPMALPHYTTEWEKCLQQLKVAPPLYLHGNYLGSLGLARILQRSEELAEKIKESYAG